jgi:ketosteroid isomerase-like protein
MSQENVERARRAIGPDPTEFFNLFDEQIEIDWNDWRLPFDPVLIRGREAAKRFWLDYWSSWSDYTVQLVEVLDAGDQVVLVLREAGTGPRSGIRTERTFANVWTFKHDKLVRLRPYETKAQALEAAGMRE